MVAEMADRAGLNIPAHVDPALVVDFDYFGDRRYAEAGNPYKALLALGEEIGRGIFWSPYNGGHWFITDHEMLFEAARTPELFASRNNSFPAVPPEEEPFLPPFNTDAPDHIKYRMPLMRAFAPARMRGLESGIRSRSIELIEDIAGQGCCDFLEAVAEPLPIFIFMRMMGFDVARYREFREWVSWMTQPDIEQRTQAYSKTIEMARPLFEERRRMPKDDLLSHLLDETIDGRPLTQRELEGICTLLFGAGLDTVVNSIAFSMEHLASDPALQDRLRRQPELIPEAVEELLRCYGVATASRSVAKDGTFHGATLKAGERVSLFLQAGNLDPAAFPAAEKFDLDRENKAHITFNSGPHRCVGSHLVRIEMAVLFEEWLKRMPNVRLNPESPPSYRTGVIFAVTSLPLLWDIPS